MPGDRLVSYFDLEGLGFVNPTTGRPYSRKHLGDMMRRGQWPKAIQVSPNRIAWRLSELMRHAATLPVARSVREGADAA
jgi:predicted DNA-binding transcriptional regulator AlpA